MLIGRNLGDRNDESTAFRVFIPSYVSIPNVGHARCFFGVFE
jgi:hypothetical protein